MKKQDKQFPQKSSINFCNYALSAVFLGFLGVHNFYAKRFLYGVFQLFLFLLTLTITFFLSYRESDTFENMAGYFSVSQNFSFNYILPFIKKFILVILGLWITSDILFVKNDGNKKEMTQRILIPRIFSASLFFFLLLLSVILPTHHQLSELIKEYPYTAHEEVYYLRRLNNQIHNGMVYDNGNYPYFPCTEDLKPLPKELTSGKCLVRLLPEDPWNGIEVSLPDISRAQEVELSQFFKEIWDKHYIIKNKKIYR